MEIPRGVLEKLEAYENCTWRGDDMSLLDFLRKSNFDELPQLFNVLRGDMSLVGPRPVLTEELGLFDDADHRRHLTKPGLTGLWQVSGRKEVDWDERMRMDLDYVENWSPALDLVIVAKTAKVVLSGKGAY